MIRNREFYQQCRDFLEASLSLLRSYVEQGEKVNDKWVEEVEFLPDKGAQIHSQLEPDLDILLSHHDKELKELPEFTNLRNFVANNEELRKELLVDNNGVPIKIQAHNHWLYQFTCLPLLSRYFIEVNDLDFKVKVFDELYKGIEDYCYSPSIRLIHVAPLFRFDMEVEVNSISLESNLTIRRLTPQERSRLWQGACDSSLWSRQDIYYLCFAVEATKETNKQEPIYDPRENLITLEALLRLIKKQPIAINFVLQRSEPWFNSRYLIGGYYTWPMSREQRLMPPFTPYFFTSQDAEQLRELWQGFKKIKNDGRPRLTLALRCFSSSYDEVKPEDNLLDLWIGLEALFSDQDQELSYRISLRMAHFLGKTGDDRETIFYKIKESYDCRSCIVHGSQSEECQGGGKCTKGKRKGRKLSDVIRQTEDYLAKSLECCLNSETVPSGKNLDDRILKGMSSVE